MDWYSFGLLLYFNRWLYVWILAGSVVLYFLIFRKSYLSFLDPFIFNLLYSVFGFSVVIFLYATDSMPVKYLYSYLLTQAAFFCGLFIYKPLSRDQLLEQLTAKTPLIEEALFMKLLFLLCSIVYVFAQLVTYKFVGIPLFMESRTGAYADSGGLGILGHIITVLGPASTFMVVYFLFTPGKSIRLNIYLVLFSLFLLLTFALSGSKSLFMNAGFILFIYLILNAPQLKKSFLRIRRFELYLLIAGLAFAFFTIVIQANSNDVSKDSALKVFLFRLVASGDTYFFSYPDGTIETINGSKGFLALFGDVFSTIRLVPRESQPQILGLQLFQNFYDSDIITGPNARHNVFGYVYYGFYGSIAFSFAIGALLSFVRNKLLFILKSNVFGQLAFMFLYLNLTFIETDPPVAITGVENVLLIFPAFIIAAMLLYIPLKNKFTLQPRLL